MERYEPKRHSSITKELRDEMRRYHKFNDLAIQHVELDAEHFDAMCDNIDTLYGLLETENEYLRKRLEKYELGNGVYVSVKMLIDWESMAEELERAAEAVRTLEEGDKE